MVAAQARAATLERAVRPLVLWRAFAVGVAAASARRVRVAGLGVASLVVRAAWLRARRAEAGS